MHKYFTYILYSESKNTYYVGSTSDIESRIVEHNNAKIEATKSAAPWMLVYFEEFNSEQEASSRQDEIKSKDSREYIETLIFSEKD